jgi:hypothetical protein
MKVFHERDDSVFGAVTKDRDGKFNRCFSHWLSTKSSQEMRNGQPHANPALSPGGGMVA